VVDSPQDVARFLVGSFAQWVPGPDAAPVPILIFSAGDNGVVNGMIIERQGTTKFMSGVRPIEQARPHPDAHPSGYWRPTKRDAALIQLLGDPTIALASGRN
jgi:hypothetical protein